MIQKIFADGLINPVLPSGLGSGTEIRGIINIGNLITALVSVFLVLATIAALLYFVLGGLSWIVSDGEKAKLEQARNKITQAILGLIVVASAWAIWSLVGNFFGLDVTKMQFPTLNNRTIQEIPQPGRPVITQD